MPLLFQSESKKETSSSGFIVAERQTAYGPGVIILLTLFGLSFVVYAALFSFRVKISSDTELIHGHTDDLERTRNKKLESEIFIFEKRINALSTILRSHVYLSRIIPLVGEVTLPTVFYDSMNVSFGAESASGATGDEIVRIELQGSAPTLLDLARQMVIYRHDPKIKSGGMSSFEIGKEDGGNTFSATLTFDKKAVLAQ
ncbi:MAG: hypothetical protein Q7S09_04765 [bacterium]|nr:hypothetical protein [bacterium]